MQNLSNILKLRMVTGLKRNDIICDCCGKTLSVFNIVQLHGVGLLSNWDWGMRERIDLCHDCWYCLIDKLKEERCNEDC